MAVVFLISIVFLSKKIIWGWIWTIYILFKAAHPIYEDIYSQVNKSGKNNKMVMAEPNNCDTDSAALERLSQLLTTDGASEVSADLIALHVTNSLDDFTNLFH